MTSENIYHHLNMLENLVPRIVRLYSASCSLSTYTILTLLQNEAGTRQWIDAIFFRVSAMLSGVLNLEHRIPSIAISVPGQRSSLRISGTVDYTALMTADPPKHGASFLLVYLTALSELL